MNSRHFRHALLLAGTALFMPDAPVLAQLADANPPTDVVTVTADRLNLLGSASTASEGVVSDQEIQLLPAYRPGQLLETVPGLTVTSHSGEGKANQYLMRGYNLDHGTDLETYVDGMPINQPTHAHGQGFTDLNFMIPELANGMTYTKGPYYAEVGDFGAVGSVNVQYRNTMPDQVSVGVGTLGYERSFAAQSRTLGEGQLLAAAEVQHYDGPFLTPDDARKENAVLRYSQNGFSLTAMLYHQAWTNTTDIPVRAINAGLVENAFGSLDASDGGHALRSSLSANYRANLGDGQLETSAFYIFNQLHLINNFTHYLVDSVHGDQEDQFETRNVIGTRAKYTMPVTVGGFDNDLMVGGLTRYDILDVGRLPSEGQVPLTLSETSADPATFSNHDHVLLSASALYLQSTTYWTSTIRSVAGLRLDYQNGHDHDLLSHLHETYTNNGTAAPYTNGGSKQQALPQPKGSLIYQPVKALEFYASGGVGFHSADLRGVNQSVNGGTALGLSSSPLIAPQWGEEVGMRTTPQKDLTLTLAVYNLRQSSETIINPDVGEDGSGPASERYGFEVNATYALNKWFELYSSISANHARFTTPYDDGTGHLGKYIADAPVAAGNLALYVHDQGPWSGGFNFRYLGDYPLTSGRCNDAAAVNDFKNAGVTSCANAPTALGQVNGKGFGQLNLDVQYAFPNGWGATLGVYNLLNTHAAAAEFYYVDRLKSEIASDPAGVADIHEHPIEPLMARITISKQF